MDADAKKAQHLFSGDHRYIVPAYQRPYVWEEDSQWRPLWEDIERLSDSRLDNKEDSHFLGAIVLKQEVAAPGGLAEWSVIDGQQRLTTLQIILSALAYSADLNGLENISKRVRSFLLHEDYKAEGDERFRFWPTTVNQDSYRNIMNLNGPNISLNDEENTIEEAWLFFVDRVNEYVARDSQNLELEFLDPDQSAEETVNVRYGALYEALIGMIELVVIQINTQEKPQVVFETLNARGTPLLATDLIKNALFEKAMVSSQKTAMKNWVWKNFYGGKPIYTEITLEQKAKVQKTSEAVIKVFTDSSMMSDLANKTSKYVENK